MDVISSLEKIIDLDFDIIRLGLYWDEIEQEKGVFDFNEIETILEICQKNNQKVILSMGAKAPRWPEFYIPKYLPQNLENKETQKNLFVFIKKAISQLKKYKIIEYWQVENEPLDEVGDDKLTIPLKFLEEEIELVKKLDNRKIIINLWGNDLSSRNFLPKIEPLTDIIGLDIYYKQFVSHRAGFNFYRGPNDSDKKLNKIITESKKPIWITELQAEPWEKDEKNYKSTNPKSMSVKKMKEFYERACKLSVGGVLFWGCEYWLWKEKFGDERYVETIKKIITPPESL